VGRPATRMMEITIRDLTQTPNNIPSTASVVEDPVSALRFACRQRSREHLLPSSTERR
jgi:hypothetical protein